MKIGFKIDNEDNVSIVRGEDKSLVVRLFDDATKIPIDLTGASVVFEAKRKSGWKVSKSTGLKTFSDSSVAITTNTLSIANHGLATNEVVTLTTTGVLPTGLALATDYFVIVVDNNTISLSLTKDGTAVDITAAAGGGVHSVVSGLITVSAILGTVTIPLSDAVTEDMTSGEKQTPEIEFTIAGVTKIVQLTKALSVLEQTV